MDYDNTRRVLAAFEVAGVRYVIFGGVALNLLGLARATEYLDVFIAPTEDNVARVRSALLSLFEDPSLEELSAEDLLGEYPAIQYVPPTGTFHLDLLTRLGEAFRFEDLDSQRLDFDGVTVSVVTPDALYRMKRDTVCLQGRADAARIKEHFGLDVD